VWPRDRERRTVQGNPRPHDRNEQFRPADSPDRRADRIQDRVAGETGELLLVDPCAHPTEQVASWEGSVPMRGWGGARASDASTGC
jgi:hypothetical protein